MNSLEQLEAARPGLAGPLFGKGEVPVYVILDGASVPGLLKKIFEDEPEYCCLYRGELEPDTATVAPYLIRLEAESPFTEKVLKEGWGAHWGVFIVSTANLRTLRNHFREFLKVELPDRRTVLFRFYDPRVLRTSLPVCNAAELGTFFGPAQTFLLEGPKPDNGIRFSLAGNALKSEAFQLKPELSA